MTTSQRDVVLSARGLNRSFDGQPVLAEIDLDLRVGEILALVGPSGGGKTTLFNLLSGLDTPDSGTVLLDGEDITGRPGRVSYMLQKDLLLPYKRVVDNVALPLLLRGMKRQQARMQAGAFFAAFGLEGTQEKWPCQLSGGMRQRAAFLRTHLAGGRCALLDEPFSALDAMTKGELHRWFLAMLDQYPMATLFITHDVDEAVLLADRVCVLAGQPGRLTSEIVIDVPRADRASFALSEPFLQYKQRLLCALKG